MGVYGIDLSNWNMNKGMFPRKAIQDSEFIFIKASEGSTWKDPTIGIWAKEGVGKVLGFYHYARPENGNSPIAEAHNFMEAIDPYVGKGALLALDWEGKALETSYHWIEKWMAEVMDFYKGMPLIYIQQSALDLVEPLYESNHGLWVAQWNHKPQQVDTNMLWAFHQYDTDDVDWNYFNGGKDQLRAYLCEKFIENDDREGSGYCGCTCECYKKGYEDGKRDNS